MDRTLGPGRRGSIARATVPCDFRDACTYPRPDPARGQSGVSNGAGVFKPGSAEDPARKAAGASVADGRVDINYKEPAVYHAAAGFAWWEDPRGGRLSERA